MSLHTLQTLSFVYIAMVFVSSILIISLSSNSKIGIFSCLLAAISGVLFCSLPLIFNLSIHLKIIYIIFALTYAKPMYYLMSSFIDLLSKFVTYNVSDIGKIIVSLVFTLFAVVPVNDGLTQATAVIALKTAQYFKTEVRIEKCKAVTDKHGSINAYNIDALDEQNNHYHIGLPNEFHMDICQHLMGTVQFEGMENWAGQSIFQITTSDIIIRQPDIWSDFIIEKIS